MRRNNLCIVKTICIIFVAILLALMVANWISSPAQNHASLLMEHKAAAIQQRRNFHNEKKFPNGNMINDRDNKDFEQYDNIQSHNDLLDSNKKVWENRKETVKQLLQDGIGERGKTARLDDVDKEKERKLFDQNGFNALLSDHISLNRSVPDIRYEGCQKKQYLSKLPTVSIIIPFYNEHWSTLLRSCYSILNRSPPELLEEIILVDDFSTKEFLGEKLEMFVNEFLPKVKIIRLPERGGLIRARLAGAKEAVGEVLIFLDSHIEASYNWLPPLLEPIAINPKASVCPFIDVIDHDTFEYRAQDEGARGAFDWQFFYKRLPLLPEDRIDKTKPFKSPIMAGGLFAIRGDFFWELGGYDEGLDIWGGEQYELSFKIWMCGGELLDAPCSRVGHIYRGSVPFRNPRKTDYLHKNYKRVAEVWMDEYKEYLYARDPERYENLDAGDLTAQKEIRERLKCKSFKWFMENIAFDLPKKYPPVEPPDYAYGTIRSVSNPTLCLDTLNHYHQQEIGLFQCAKNDLKPQANQFWSISWHKDLRLHGKTDCLDVSQSIKNAPVLLYDCHGQQGNQMWFYDVQHKWLVQGRNKRCLEADIKQKKIMVNICDANNKNMKWNFGYVNHTALKNFDKDDEL